MKDELRQEFPAMLLGWYKTHARELPWRKPPGSDVPADPYHVWLSEIMLQQTTVAAVRAFFNRFLLRWPTVADLANADDDEVMAEWAGLGYYARARNLLKCARIVTDRGGEFPRNEGELLKLPGIGPYTAAAMTAIAFGKRAVVVDGNVERVMARLFSVIEPLPGAKPQLRKYAGFLTPKDSAGDYAQAVMDLGATICTPRSPDCPNCPVADLCLANSRGIAEQLPMKLPKREKPTRFGHVYVARREDGAILLERRSSSGLLGGMMGFPGSDWREKNPAPAPPFPANWRRADAPVRHSFTHFHLILSVHAACVDQNSTPERGHFQPAVEFSDRALPTVMRKVFNAGQSVLNEVMK